MVDAAKWNEHWKDKLMICAAIVVSKPNLVVQESGIDLPRRHRPWEVRYFRVSYTAALSRAKVDTGVRRLILRRLARKRESSAWSGEQRLGNGSSSKRSWN
jgi:hypothetical protein